MAGRSSRSGASGDSLLTFVPRHVAADILRHPGSSPLGREQRFDAAALFADISGFTPMSEALGRAGTRGTEELTVTLNGYFTRMIDLVHSYRGVVGKFGGDALTVIFPAQGKRSRAPRRAVACGLAMQDAMVGYDAVATAVGTFRLEAKIGVAAGAVLCTSVGDPATRLEYVVAGSAIDLCADAEHRAAPGEVVAHADLLQRCSGIELDWQEGDFARVTAIRPRPTRSRPGQLPRSRAAALPTLAAYLHPVIAERLLAGLGSFVDEHRRLTVLFVGFGGPDYSNRDAAMRLQAYLAPAVEIITRYDGHLRQVETGDKGSLYIAFFGAPVSHEDDEERALRAALELRELPGDRARIGVASGWTFCGCVGSPERQEYAAVGDTVNIAARLMQAAGPGEILVGGPIAERARRAVRLDLRAPVAVKGKSRRVPVAALVGRAKRLRGLGEREFPLPMVGRDWELASFVDALEGARTGVGCVVAIAGEAGIGKSRLTAELLRAAEDRGLQAYTGACQSYGQATVYLPWQEIWRAMFGLEPGEPAGAAAERARLERNLAALDPGLVPRLPLLAPAVRVPIPENALTKPLEPELRAELLRSLLVDVLRRRAVQAPLVLVLEDCHWIDPLSLELLEAIGRAVSSIPVLLAVSYRPSPAERSPVGWAAGLPHVTHLRLGPLTGDDVASLVETKLRASFGWTSAVPGAVAALAVRAEGNPFYLEETINLLRDRGIELSDADAVARAAIPDTLAGVVMARIDRLGEREKTTLKVASVIGRRFRDAWVWGSSPELGGKTAVGASLDDLTRGELTAVASLEPEPEHLFRHVTTRDVAYESLSHSLRQELHGRIGSHVERRHANTLDRYVDTLAHHFGESANADKQRTYFRRAGDQARATYANAAALDYYSRLLPLLAGSEQREVLLALGQVREHIGDWQGAEEAYRTALRLAEEDAHRAGTAESRRALGALLAHQRSPAEGRELLERALAEFESEHDPDGIVRTLEGLGYAAWKQSDYEASLEHSAEHLRRAELAADAEGISMAEGQIGLARWARGEHDLALRAFERARDTAAAAGNARGTIHAGNDLAGLHWERGDYTGALDGVRASLAAAEEIGYRHAVAVLSGNAAEIYRCQGELETALALSSRALELLAELGDSVGIASQLGNMAITLAALERSLEAEELFDLAIGLAREVESLYFLCEYLHQSAVLLTRLGRHAEAAVRNGEALAVSREISRGDVLAPAELLDVSLGLSLATLTEAEATVELERLLVARLEPAERAAAIFELWRTAGREEHRTAAASLYRELHGASPLATYRERHLTLTGEALEPPAPLPRLYDDLGDANAATVLARAREIAAAARAAAPGREPARG